MRTAAVGELPCVCSPTGIHLVLWLFLFQSFSCTEVFPLHVQHFNVLIVFFLTLLQFKRDTKKKSCRRSRLFTVVLLPI